MEKPQLHKEHTKRIFLNFAFMLTICWIVLFCISFAGIRISLQNRLYTELDRKTSLVLENMRQSVSLLADNGRWDEIQRMMENAGTSPLISRIRVISLETGLILCSSDPIENGTASDSVLVRELIEKKTLKAVTSPKDIDRSFAAAVSVPGAIAAIEYIADIKTESAIMNIEMNSLVLQNLGILLLMLAACLTFLWCFVSLPLKRFGEVTEKVIAGDYSVKMVSRSNDEFRTFTLIFNHMIEVIGQKTEELTEYSETLERKVSQRTKSLEKANVELLLTRDRLHESEKAAESARILGGIAHEINNPASFVLSNLTTMETYADYLIQKILEQGMMEEDRRFQEIRTDTKELLAESRAGIKRIAEIISSMKAITIAAAVTSPVAHINEILSSIVDAKRSSFPDSERLQLNLLNDRAVEANATDLQQAIAHIVDNAVDAVFKGGNVLVESRDEEDVAVVEVSDTGCGMDAKVLEKAFDPFFTTKQAKNGVGLSLSISKAVVERMGGNIEASSKVGSGSTFIIRMPYIFDEKASGGV